MSQVSYDHSSVTLTKTPFLSLVWLPYLCTDEEGTRGRLEYILVSEKEALYRCELINRLLVFL